MRRLREVCECMPCGGHQHGGKGRCTVKSTRKKRWSDYLWIAELCYLFLGAVQYPVRMAGDAVFLYPAVRRHFRRQQSLLQPLLRARPAFQPAGRKAEIVPEHPAAQVSAQPVVPLWFFNLLYGDVRPDAVQHLPGIYRRAPFADGDASVGIQAPVAVGGREFCGPVDRAVCLRLFRRYAHLDGAGPFDNGIVPAPVVVRILPDGNHDPGNLQIKERKEGKGIWKNRQRK